MISQTLKQKLKNCGDLKHHNWEVIFPLLDTHDIPDYSFLKSIGKTPVLSKKDLTESICKGCNNNLMSIIDNIGIWRKNSDDSLLTCNEFMIKKLLE